MGFRFVSYYLDDTPVEGRALDVFEAESVGRPTALLFVHGGGWRGGARAHFHPLMWAFRREGYVCATCDYRLTGTRVQDQLTDIRHGYDRFCSHLRETGGPDRVFLIGSSAGVHLAALVALAAPGVCGESLEYGETRLAAKWRPPVGAALSCGPATFEPWDDIFPPVWDAMRSIVGVSYEDDPEAYRRVSPIRQVSETACPLLLLQAGNEHMFPLELTEALAAALRRAGRRAEIRVYPTAEHGFFYGVTRRPQQQAFADILAFIESLD